MNALSFKKNKSNFPAVASADLGRQPVRLASKHVVYLPLWKRTIASVVMACITLQPVILAAQTINVNAVAQLQVAVVPKARAENLAPLSVAPAPKPTPIAPVDSQQQRVNTTAAQTLTANTAAQIANASAQNNAAAISGAANAPSGQKPIIDAAQNGVPIVLIAPPSQGGVSRNLYDQFNVGSNGLILNNSSSPVGTQLGGQINGNVQLGSTPARIILNEVVSSNPSTLRGTIEVAGQRADVVIANPNGITCDGCGFLNAAAATLTTGRPLIDANHELAGFAVSEGQLLVGPRGLDATSVARLDLAARSVVIEGEVWARSINLLAGANNVLYGTVSATPIAGRGPAPRFAIDIAALGGMYANSIYIVATDKGLGVNSEGRISALTGKLELSSAGDLVLKDVGASQGVNLQAAGNTKITGQVASNTTTDIRSDGSVTFGKDASVGSQSALTVKGNDIANLGTLVQRSEQSALKLEASGQLFNQGKIYSANTIVATGTTIQDQGGELSAVNAITLDSTSISLSNTKISTNTSLNIRASESIQSSNATLYGKERVELRAGQAIVSSATTIQSSDQVGITAQTIENRDGTQIAASNLVDLSADRIVNDASTVASESRVRVQARDELINRGGTTSAKVDLELKLPRLTNEGGTIVSDSSLALDVQTLSNTAGGRIASGDSVAINAQSIDNSGGTLAASAGLSIAAAATLNNAAGTLQAGGALTVKANSFDNQGGVTSASGGVQINSRAISNQSGLIAGQGTTAINASRVDNTGGKISSASAILFNATTVQNNGGEVVSGGATQIVADSFDNTGGKINGQNGLDLDVANLTNTRGAIGGSGTVNINTRGRAFNNDGGKLESDGNLTINSSSISNVGGRLSGVQGLSLTANSVNNTRGELVSGGDLRIDLSRTGSLNNSGGRVSADGIVSITGGTVNNTADTSAASGVTGTGGVISGNQGVRIDVESLINGATFRVESARDVTVVATGGVTNAGNISAGSNLSLTAQSLTNQAGALLSAGRDLTADVTGLLQNAGRLVAEGNVRLNANSVNNDNAQIIANGSSVIAASAISNHGGVINAGADLTLIATNGLDNSGGTIASNGSTVVGASSVLNQAVGTQRAQIGGQTVLISTDQLTNNNSVIAAGTGGLTILNGKVQNENGAQLSSGGALTIATPNSALNNAGGVIVATGALNIVATQVTNSAASISGVSTGGQISGATSVGITTGALDNSGGLIVTEGAATVTTLETLKDVVGPNVAAIALPTGIVLPPSNIASVSTPFSGTITNNGGRITAANALNVNAAGGLSNTNGGVINVYGPKAPAGTAPRDVQSLTVAARTIDNSAGIISTNDNLSVTATAATATTTSTATTINNEAGQIIAGGSSTIAAASLNNAAKGEIFAGKDQTLNVATVVNAGESKITATGAVTINASDVRNTSSQIAAGADLTLIATNGLDNSGGTIASNGSTVVGASSVLNQAVGTQRAQIGGQTVLISTDQLTNNNSVIAAGTGGLTILNGKVQNENGAQLSSGGALTIATPNSALNNAGGVIVATGALNIVATQVTNSAASISGVSTGGQISGATSVGITTGALDNSGGLIVTEGAATVTTLETLKDVVGPNVAAIALPTGIVLPPSNIASVSTPFSGTITNNGGRITAANALNVNAAGGLSNTNGGVINVYGPKAPAGTAPRDVQSLTVAARTIDNSAGIISTNDNLSVTATAATATTTSTATTINNEAGQIIAGGSSTIAAASLNNAAKGEIFAGKDQTLNVATVVNAGESKITATGAVTINASDVRNTGALIESGADLSLNTTTLTNENTATVRGVLSAGGKLNVRDGISSSLITGGVGNSGDIVAGTAVDIQVASVVANSGQIVGTQSVSITGSSLNNTSGIVYAGQADATGNVLVNGNVNINVGTGSIDNTRGQIGSTEKIAITSGSLTNVAGNISGAGDLTLALGTTKLDNTGGQIAVTGKLDISAGETINDRGVLAAKDIKFTVGALSNVAGGITATDTVNIAAATLTNNGIAGVDATATTPAIIARYGTIYAGKDVEINLAAALDNNALGIIQSGNNATSTAGVPVTLGTLKIAATTVDNAGTIASTGALSVGKEDLTTIVTNTGTLQSASTLSVNAAKIVNPGLIVASGDVTLANGTLTANTIDNTGGIIQSQGSVTFDAANVTNAAASGAAVGTGGVVIANQTLTIKNADSINNATGILQGINALTLTANSEINNKGGTIVSGRDAVTATAAAPAVDAVAGNITVTSGTLNNSVSGAISATGTLTVTATQSINNATGVLIANKLVDINAGELLNQGGIVVSKQDGIDISLVNGTRTLDNSAGGIIQAELKIDLQAGEVKNNLGTIFGGSIEANTGAFNNTGGTLAATTTLNATTGALDNRGGLITGDTITINTQGNRLDNSNTQVPATSTAQQGIIGTGLTLQVGELDNRSGFIAAQGALAITAAGNVDNTNSGLLYGGSRVSISTPQSVLNSTGTIYSKGNITIGNGITAATLIDNANGKIVGNGNVALHATNVQNDAGYISGYDVSITATSKFSNTNHGVVISDRATTINATTIDNTYGEIYAKGNVVTNSVNPLLNQGGKIIGLQDATITTGGPGPDPGPGPGPGTGTGTTETRNACENVGTVAAGNSVTINTGSANCNVGAGGLIKADGDVEITTTGNVNNSGTITAGDDLSISAANVNNTGAMFGDKVAISVTGSLLNSNGGVIGARGLLDISGVDISNTGGSELVGDGGITISTGSLANLSSRIASRSGDISIIATNDIVNKDVRLRVLPGTPQTTPDTMGIEARRCTAEGNYSAVAVACPVGLIAQGRLVDVLPAPGALSSLGPYGYPEPGYRYIVNPDAYGTLPTLPPTWSEVCTGSADSRVCQPIFDNTEASGAAWRAQLASRIPTRPEARTCSSSDYDGNITIDTSPACVAWRTDEARYWSELQTLVDSHNAIVRTNDEVILIRDFTFVVTGKITTTPSLVDQAPAIIAGNNVTLSARNISNVDSRIIAGGSLSGVARENADNQTTRATNVVETTVSTRTSTLSQTSGWDRIESIGVLSTVDRVETVLDLQLTRFTANGSVLPPGSTGNPGTGPGTGGPGTGTPPAPTIPTRITSGDLSRDPSDPTGTNAITRSGDTANGPGTLNTRGGITRGITGVDGTISNDNTGSTYSTNLNPGLNASLATGANVAAVGALNSTANSASTTGPQSITTGNANVVSGVASSASTTGPQSSTTLNANVVAETASGATTGANSLLSGVNPTNVRNISALPTGTVNTGVPAQGSINAPGSKLFNTSTAPSARYVVETNPNFTNGRTFLGSDYYFNQLNINPATAGKRYGDGYAEQREIDDQIMSLTGRRYLSGYSSTEEQFRELMDAGVSVAQSLRLSPGVELTAEQVAQLTDDIVWMVNRTVVLADGTTTTALTPQVYLRRPGAGDLNTSGALMSGTNVVIRANNINNSGTILADNTVALVAAQDITNRFGDIRATRGDVLLQAGNDIANLSGRIQAANGLVALNAGRDMIVQTLTNRTSVNVNNQYGSSIATRTNVERTASIGGGDVSIYAGRNVNIIGANLQAGATPTFDAASLAAIAKPTAPTGAGTTAPSAVTPTAPTGNLQIVAQGNVVITPVAGTYQINAVGGTGYQGRVNQRNESATTNQASNLTAQNNVTVVAGYTPAGVSSPAPAGVSNGAPVPAAPAAGATPAPAVTPNTGNVIVNGANVTAGNAVNITGSAVSISAAVNSQASDITGAGSRGFTRNAQSTQTATGGTITGGGNVLISATGAVAPATSSAPATPSTLAAPALGSVTPASGSVTLSGAQLASLTGQAQITATGNVDIAHLNVTQSITTESADRRSGFLSSTRTAQSNSTTVSQVVGSEISGNTVVVQAGVGQTAAQAKDTGTGNINVSGSTIVSSGGTTLKAPGNISIVSAQETTTSSNSASQSRSGLLSNGGPSVMIGRTSNSSSGNSTETRQVGSTIAAGISADGKSPAAGNVVIAAGGDVRITSSNVIAQGIAVPATVDKDGKPIAASSLGGNVAISGTNVTINSAQDTSSGTSSSQSRSSGLTIGVSSPILSGAQTIGQMANTARQSSDPRTQGLAAVTGGLAAVNTYDALKNPSVSLDISLGSQRSSSNSSYENSTSVGSNVIGSNNVTLTATGNRDADGKPIQGASATTSGNITIIGSTINAGNVATLDAGNQINLIAGESTTSSQSRNSSSGASLGVSIGYNGNSVGVSVNASANRANGNSTEQSTTYTNTTVTGGQAVNLISGGDTTLRGAQVIAPNITANIGGDLNIQSLQDSATTRVRETSVGVGVSVPIVGGGTPSVSVSGSRTAINSDYASVRNQSGIFAGDGGFQIDVKGNTTLIGGAILSSDTARQNNLNALSTQSITATDIQNRATYSGSTVGASASYSGNTRDRDGNIVKNSDGSDKQPGYNGLNASPPVAIGASGNATSTTQSAVTVNADGSGINTTNAAGVTGTNATNAITGTLNTTATVALATIETSGITTAGIDPKAPPSTQNALKPIFNEREVRLGMDTATAFTREVGTYIQARAIEANNKQERVQDLEKIPANQRTPEEQAELNQLRVDVDTYNQTWGPGGTYRQVATALTAGVGGNVSGGLGNVAINSAVNYVQQQGATWVGQQVSSGAIKEGSAEHVALQALIGCAGAAASSQSCGAGAVSAATGTIINSLANDADGGGDSLTIEQREARRNLLLTLLTVGSEGIAAARNNAAPSATATVLNAATAETDNNGLRSRAAIFTVKQCLGRPQCALAAGFGLTTLGVMDDKVSKLMRETPGLSRDGAEAVVYSEYAAQAGVAAVQAGYRGISDFISTFLGDESANKPTILPGTPIKDPVRETPNGYPADPPKLPTLAGTPIEDIKLPTITGIPIEEIKGPNITTTPIAPQGPIVMLSEKYDPRLPIPEQTFGSNGLPISSNSKHTPGAEGWNRGAGTEPRNSLDLFNSSVSGGDGKTQYASDAFGNIHRYFTDKNGVYHWAGSTGDKGNPLDYQTVPIEIRRLFKFPSKGR
jgi:filamentous hemagglutinin